MIFDVYGRFEIEVLRRHGHWVAYRLGPGMRHVDYDVTFAPDIPEDEIEAILDDMFKDLAIPAHSVRRIG